MSSRVTSSTPLVFQYKYHAPETSGNRRFARVLDICNDKSEHDTVVQLSDGSKTVSAIVLKVLFQAFFDHSFVSNEPKSPDKMHSLNLTGIDENVFNFLCTSFSRSADIELQGLGCTRSIFKGIQYLDVDPDHANSIKHQLIDCICLSLCDRVTHDEFLEMYTMSRDFEIDTEYKCAERTYSLRYHLLDIVTSQIHSLLTPVFNGGVGMDLNKDVIRVLGHLVPQNDIQLVLSRIGYCTDKEANDNFKRALHELFSDNYSLYFPRSYMTNLSTPHTRHKTLCMLVEVLKYYTMVCRFVHDHTVFANTNVNTKKDSTGAVAFSKESFVQKAVPTPTHTEKRKRVGQSGSRTMCVWKLPGGLDANTTYYSDVVGFGASPSARHKSKSQFNYIRMVVNTNSKGVPVSGDIEWDSRPHVPQGYAVNPFSNGLVESSTTVDISVILKSSAASERVNIGGCVYTMKSAPKVIVTMPANHLSFPHQEADHVSLDKISKEITDPQEDTDTLNDSCDSWTVQFGICICIASRAGA